MKHHRLAQSNSMKSHSKLFHYKKLLQIYRFTFNSANLQQFLYKMTLNIIGLHKLHLCISCQNITLLVKYHRIWMLHLFQSSLHLYRI